VAATLAQRAVVSVNGVGAFGVELFLRNDGSIWINELAPRVHNSGHYTIEACETSQFENHLRAVLGLPLGSVRLKTPAAVMINVLGRRSGLVPARIADPTTKDVYLHWYGKSATRPGRKMGHVTALGSTMDEARDRAVTVAESIQSLL